MRAGVVALGLVAAVGLALWAGADGWWREPAPLAQVQAAGGRPDAASTAPQAAVLSTGDGRHDGLEALPTSLGGTEVSGRAEQDAQGRLKVSRGLRDLFDYFLSASGEEPPALLRARVLAYLGQGLGAAAQAQAMALFDAYVAYKRELDGLALGARATTFEEMQARLQAVRSSRSRHFTPDVVAAFWGDEAAYDRYALDKQAVLGDTALTAAEKARRLAALRAELPAGLREQLGAVETVVTLDQLTQDWQQRGGGAAELRQLRESLVGPAAAGRLEALDRETAAWGQRVQAYLAQRARIAADPTLADSARQQQLQSLRDVSFAGPERIRIETIERP